MLFRKVWGGGGDGVAGTRPFSRESVDQRKTPMELRAPFKIRSEQNLSHTSPANVKIS